MGEPNSFHEIVIKSRLDLMNQPQHITRAFERHNSQKIAENKSYLKVSIDATKYLILQGLVFRGHDEKQGVLNCGKFLQLVVLLSSYDKKEREIGTIKPPENVTYTSGQTQKEIIEIISQKVKKKIREEICGAKYCIIADESEDESHKEQMEIVLRFVDKKDILQNIHGQGYDGANNMRGQFNGLQALIANECPYAYYVHCLAHHLQLTLVSASTEVIHVEFFFEKLKYILNSCTGSAKCNDDLHDIQVEEMAQMIETCQLNTGSGLNQIGNRQRVGDTRWGSYLRSVSSLIKMFNTARTVFDNVIDEGKTPTQHGQAFSALEVLNSFEFVLILHFIKEMMEIIDALSQALQKKSQDIASDIYLVQTTKILIQGLRDSRWDEFLPNVKYFCANHNIVVTDLSSPYKGMQGCSRNNIVDVTIESHYHIDIFYDTINFKLQELNTHFSEQSMNLIYLSCALDPKEKCDSFDVERFFELATIYYPKDFSEREKEQYLRMELRHYEVEVSMNEELKALSSITKLCKWMFTTGRSTAYPLIYILVSLVLTLPVSTAITEHAFLAMRIVKNRLRTKMSDDFLTNSLIAYIEREIINDICVDSIIDSFRDKSRCKVAF